MKGTVHVNTISPHSSPAELTDYAARRLTATDVLRVSDHLAACAVCHETLMQVRQPFHGQPGDFIAEGSGEMPMFDELAGEIDGTLTAEQREELAAKLAASPAAREALADLAAFREELAGLPPKFHGPEQTPGTGPVRDVGGNIVTPPRWRWHGAVSRAAGLAALLLTLAVGWWVFAHIGHDDAGLLRDAAGRRADLAELPANLRESVEAAARTGRLPTIESNLVADHEVLAGAAAAPLLAAVFPVGTVVRESRPVLRWTPRDGATGYTVYLSPADGAPLVSSPLLSASQTQWAPPVALQRGEVYEWQVEALRNGVVIDRAPKPPAGEARFQVLDAEHEAELTTLEKREASYPLILGVAYWRAGLTNAAAEQFHRLAQAQAHSSVAQRLERAADVARAP